MPKKAFSGKQKKQQLQAKKERKQGGFLHQKYQVHDYGSDEGANEEDARFVQAKAGPSAGGGSSGDAGQQFTFFETGPAAGRHVEAGRYALKFRPESKAEIEKLKAEARQVLHAVNPEYLECGVEDFYSEGLNFPVRPKWDYNISREALQAQEQRYFTEYLKSIDENFKTAELSYFELNLETWRQFWRVLEMSDILLCVVDIRFPALLFPPKLYDYCQKTLGKNVIVVLNKIDIVPAPLVVAWKDYFQKHFPGLQVLCFTSYEGRGGEITKNESGMTGRRKFRKLRMATEGSLELHRMIDGIVAGQVDLSSWKAKILDESKAGVDDEDELEVESLVTAAPDCSYYEFKKYKDGILTIGTIGQPNTGKSSLINGLMGKKVVSVSKTPGHTKHFQTIFLTSNVRLCDCPGLIFPSKVPKPLQVLCGSYPIAQLREPFSTVKYLAERTPLVGILKITHPEGGREWSAFDITDGWAEKKGFHTAKTSRLDSYRAANQILRLALEGRIVLALRPTGYTKNEAVWKNDSRVAAIETMNSGIVENGRRSLDVSEEEESSDEDKEDRGNKGDQGGLKDSFITTTKSSFAFLTEDDA